MVERQRLVKFLAVGLAMAVVSVVGASPVLAQSDPEPDSEASDESTSADDLLAKTVEHVRSVFEDEAPNPMMQVNSDLRIMYGGDSQWDIPDFNWHFVSLLDSEGNSDTTVTLTAPEWTPSTNNEQLAANFLNNYRMGIVVDDTAYDPIDLDGKVLESLGFEGSDSCADLYESWVTVTLPDKEDRYDNQQRVLQHILNDVMEFTSLYYLVSLGDDFLWELLSNSESPEIIEQDIVNGHDTSRIRLSIPAGLLAFPFVPYLEIMLTSLAMTGYASDRVVPEDLLELVLGTSPDYSYDIWVDDDGRVHRLHADLSFALGGYFEEFFSESGFVVEALENTFTSEAVYLEENPVIELPPANQIIDSGGDGFDASDITDGQHLVCLAEIGAFYASQPSDGDGDVDGDVDGDEGEELPSTGVNTLLMAIVGLSAMAAGLMVLGLSRRLRA